MFCVQLPVRLELLLTLCVSGVSSESKCNSDAFDCTKLPAFYLLITCFLAGRMGLSKQGLSVLGL